MRKFTTGFVAGVLLGLLLATATFSLAANPIKLVVNGRDVPCNPAPQMIQGRVFVPIRFVAEALGVEVDWDDRTQTVQISSQQVDMAGQSRKSVTTLKVNGKPYQVAWKLENGELFVSGRPIFDFLLQKYGSRIRSFGQQGLELDGKQLPVKTTVADGILLFSLPHLANLSVLEFTFDTAMLDLNLR